MSIFTSRGLAAALLVVLTAPGWAAEPWKPAAAPLMTRWGKLVTPDNAWRGYPRPQMVREKWENLNGLWPCAITPAEAGRPGAFDAQVLVPFCIESALGGLGKKVTPQDAVWYRRTFTAPPLEPGGRLLLHFGGVDWHAQVWVNGTKIGEHFGHATPFTFDITDALKPTGEQEIVLRAWDPTDTGAQPRGKQVLEPKGIWYTAVTGIWQTVWLEPVGAGSFERIGILVDFDGGKVTFTPELRGARPGLTWEVSAAEGGKAKVTGPADKPLVWAADPAQAWTPDTPRLVPMNATLRDGGRVIDTVGFYYTFRKIDRRRGPDGIDRLYLNNHPLFQYGPLDQGWWPDGLLTPPSDEAMRYDLQVLKQCGFNMLRKHIKVEPAAYYRACDEIGLLVWQDMPSGMLKATQHVKRKGPTDAEFTAEQSAVYHDELKAMIDHLRPFGCIVVWVPFNEGWGQHDTNAVLQWVKQYDPTRVVNGPSGWEDRGWGEMYDMHLYPGPGMFPVTAGRASVLGEFGGLGLPVAGHLWQQDKNWGYRTYQTPEELLTQYTKLMTDLRPLIDQGLSAAVYTQTTDVEGEVNGLLTYDREVLKMPAEKLRQLHMPLYAPAAAAPAGK